MGKKQGLLIFFIGMFFCTQAHSQNYVYQEPLSGEKYTISTDKEGGVCTFKGGPQRIINDDCSSFNESNLFKLSLLVYGTFELNKEALDEYDRRELAGEFTDTLIKDAYVKTPMHIENKEFNLSITKKRDIEFMNSDFSNIYRVRYESKKRYGGGGIMLFSRNKGLIAFSKIVHVHSSPGLFLFLVGECGYGGECNVDIRKDNKIKGSEPRR